MGVSKQALRTLDQLLLPLGVDAQALRTQVLIFAVRSVALQLGRHLAAERLANQWQLHVAHTAERALEQLHAAKFDLIVIDLSDARIRAALSRILMTTGSALTLGLVDDEHGDYAAGVREAGVDEVLETRHLLGPSMARLLRLMLERARADSQTRLLAAAVESSPIGHVVTDALAPDVPLVYVNQAFTRLTGYERHEVLGRNCRFLQGPDTDSRDVDRIRAAIAAGEQIQIELLNYGKDGQPFWNAMGIQPIRAANNTVTHFVATIRDVTIQKTATASLQRNAHVHRMLIEANGSMVIFADENGLPRTPNTEFEEYTGLSREQYQTGNWSSVIHPEDRANVDQLTRSGIVTRKSTTFIARLWHVATSEWRYTEWRFLPLFDSRGTVTEWIGALTDIHDRKSAELALRRHEEFLNTVLDSLPLLVLYANSSGTVMFANRTACEWLGRDRVALEGAHLGDLPNAGGEVAQRIEAVLSGQHVRFIERTVTAELERLLEITYVPHRSESSITGFFVIAADTREREMLLQGLQQAQKMEAVGRLTGGIAHDFNNLLNIIIGNLQLIGRAAEAPSPIARQVATGLRAAMRGADLTRRLLTFSRQQAPNPTSLAVAERVLGMADLLKRTLRDDIEVRFEVDHSTGNALLDAAQLESALLNLAINARDAMPHGGTLHISTRQVRVAANSQPETPALLAGDYVLIEVRDTGIGMSDAVRERALQPFFTTKNEDKGAGLGLSMVDVFVKQSGGNLRIQSALGAGTSVRLYFTACVLAAEPPVDPGKKEIPRGTETVLLVEDESDVRTTTAQMLASLGYRIIEASTAIDAMEILQKRSDIDALFTDVMLPGGVLGTTLVERARTLRPQLAILLTTGFAETGVLDGSNRYRGFNVVWKPYQFIELADALRKTLDANSLAVR